MRLFTALALPAEVVAALDAAQEALRADFRFRRWQPLEQAHVTLNFLGEVAAERVDDVVAAMDAVAPSHAPFSLGLGPLGRFGSARHPHVVYAHIAGAALPPLQAALKDALEARGFALEARAYRPHITLARDATAPVDWQALVERVSVAPVSWRAHEVVLFRSELRPTGAVHTAIATRALRESP